MDTRFIDVDLSVVPDDQSAGLIEQTDDEIMASFGPSLGSFEDDYPHLMVPRAKRKEYAERNWATQRKTVHQIYSQGRTSACVGFGAAQALEVTRARRYGVENHVSLSGMFVYKHIGRTLMSGAYIPDGMETIVEKGTLPLSSPENDDRFEHTWGLQDWSSRIPREAYSTARNFRVSKWGIARGKDEIESAMLNNLCGIVGRSRHCVPYVGLTWHRGGFYVPYANSWSFDWGDEGFGFDSERVYRNLSLYLILEVVADEPA